MQPKIISLYRVFHRDCSPSTSSLRIGCMAEAMGKWPSQAVCKTANPDRVLWVRHPPPPHVPDFITTRTA